MFLSPRVKGGGGKTERMLIDICLVSAHSEIIQITPNLGREITGSWTKKVRLAS